MDDIKRVPLKNRPLNSVYHSADGSFEIKEQNAQRSVDSSERQSALAEMYNKMDSNKTSVDSLDIWKSARTPNSFNVNAQQALNPFHKIGSLSKDQTQHVTFFDIEAIGTPKHLEGKHGIDMFAVTELSFGGSKYKNGNFSSPDNIKSIAVAPGKHEYQKMKEQIDLLKKNPLATVTEDMRRSLLDLAKYSDGSKFVKMPGMNGMPGYTAVTGHARVPAANTALTRNTLKEIEMGLSNLSSATPFDAAMDIFQNEISSKNSILGGYNIHHYDLPALLGRMKEKRKSFFEKSMSDSLDFFHAFSATTKNPYELTGASLRQEHLHQKLVKDKTIPSAKDASQYLYHLAADDIQANAEIAGFTNKHIQDFLNGANQSDYALSNSVINRNPIKAGDNLFSFQSGYFDPRVHKYNLVATNVDDKTVAPRWSNLDTALPSNENFTVNKFMKNVPLPGTDKKGFGVKLDSTDITGKSVMLFSETQEKLAQQLHGSFMSSDDAIAKGLRDLKVQHDQAFREYDKMFDFGGAKRMERNYSILDSGKSKMKQSGIAEKDFDWKKHVKSMGESDELALKFEHMIPRLNEERGIWQNSLNELNKAGITDAQKDISLRHIKEGLDQLGDNKKEVFAEGNKFFSFNFGKEDTTILNAKNTDSIKGTFRSFINGRRNGERVGTPEESFRRDRINRLSDMIIEQFNLSKEGKEAQKIKAIAKGMVSEVQSGNKIETALTSMANFVRDEVETKGRSGFVREITNDVTDQRKVAITQLTDNLPSVIQESIAHSQSYAKADDIMKGNSKLRTFLDEQDNRIKALFKKNFGMHGMNDAESIKRAGDMAAQYKKHVGQILNNYSNDFNTQIHFMNEGKNPILVLADKKSGMDVSRVRTYEDIVRNPKLAHIELPSFDENLKVNWGSGKKTPLIKSGYHMGSETSKAGVYHSTTVTDALAKIANYSKTAKEMKDIANIKGTQNHFIKMTQALKFSVDRQVSPVPTSANRKLNYDDLKEFEMGSAISNEVRSSKWDVTGFSEKWYRDNKTKFGFTMSIENIHKRMEKENISFYEAMPMNAKTIAVSGELQDFASTVPGAGLNATIFGNNNRSAAKGRLNSAGGDARIYNALGNYYADSVENPHKTINTRPINKEYAAAALTRAGRNQEHRLHNSFISDAAYDVLTQNGNEVRGIQFNTGKITDEEISLKLKDANTVNRYKRMIEKSNAPEKMKRQMIASIEKGMLSTSEGLGVMDYQLMQAFDGFDEKRINIQSNNVKLHKTIEDAIEKHAMEQGLGDGLWKETGITFKKPIDIDISEFMNDDGMVTLGDFTTNNIIDEKITDKTSFRKKDKVKLLGYNADDPFSRSLVMGIERKTGHGFKMVTEGGFRGTMQPMLKEIISDIYGQEGTELLIENLSSKKGTNDLASLIRGFDSKIRETYGGEAVSNRLKELYDDVERTFGIETKLQDTGQYTVSSEFGLDGKKLNFEDREKFSKQWQEKLNMNREQHGEIVMAHDVWHRQGGLNRGKITTKELTMLDRSYVEAGIVKPGQRSAHSKWLSKEVYGVGATGQMLDEQRIFGETIKAAVNYKDRDWKPKIGDAVIDFTSDGAGLVGDVNAQMNDGVLHVSKDSFKPMPDVSTHKQKFTVADYAKTVIGAGSVEYQLGDGTADSIQNYLMKNKGTVYLKLPEEFSKSHIPIIDVDSIKMPSDMGQEDKIHYLDQVKGEYNRIIKNVEDYNTSFAKPGMSEEEIKKITDHRTNLRTKIDNGIDNLLDTFANSTSNDGMAKIMSKRLDMSSQYQFGGVNPLLAYSKEDGKWVNNGGAKEGHVYMNEVDVRNLVGDKSENIAKSWGVDTTKIKPEDMTDYVIKNWNENSTYSTNIRYPSIDSGTTQTMQVKISDAVGKGQVVGLRGMAERIKGDYDGDNIAVFLSHYGIDDKEERNAVLSDLSKSHKYNYERNMANVDTVMNEMESNFRGALAEASNLPTDHKDIAMASDKFFSSQSMDKDFTIGNHTVEETKGLVNKAISTTNEYDNWGVAKNGYMENGQYKNLALEEHNKSLLARSTSMTIGSADNTRYKMSAAFMSMSEIKYNLFNNAEGNLRYGQRDYIKDTSMVNEFLREFSQKAISAKKTDGIDIHPQAMAEELQTLMKRVQNVGSESDMDGLVSELSQRLYTGKDTVKVGNVFEGSPRQLMKNSLELLSQAENTFSEIGFNVSNESSLMFGAGNGFGFEKLANVVQTGEHIPTSEMTNYLTVAAEQAGNERMSIQRDNIEKAVGKVHLRGINNANDRLQDASSALDIMNIGGNPKPTLMSNAEMPIHNTIKSQINDSFADMATTAKKAFSGSAGKAIGLGAAAFSGIWATNALMKSAPTPEGLQEMAPVEPNKLVQPTARVTPNENGEYLNIQINAKSAQAMNTNDISAMINNEIMAMSNIEMRTNVNINDNSQKIDSKWLDKAVANGMDKGYSY